MSRTVPLPGPAGQTRWADAPSAASPPALPMSASAAREIVAILKKSAGIRVDPGNTQFLSFRMDRRLTELGLRTYDEYLVHLQGRHGAAEVQALVESLATHTTSFFREPAHYEWLEKTGMPRLVDQGAGLQHPLTIWSAACSSGQELWSAGIVMDRISRQALGGLRWGLVGTDISAPIVRKATMGIYTSAELSGLPQSLRREYLLRSRPGAKVSPDLRVYRVAPVLRGRASFLQANLLDNLDGKVPLSDVVFLRNVLIYFNAEDRVKALKNVMQRMRTGAVLLLGHSDNLQGMPGGLVPCGTATFRKD
jgi:chemotaxis protein methyltransferase CheR